MKKNIIVIVSVLILIAIGALLIGKASIKSDNKKATSTPVGDTDALKFKQEYEERNGTVNESNGKEYRSITISKDNSFVYATAGEIIDKIEKDETFVVYFGFPTCPWCRSVLPVLDQVTKEIGIQKIYYVNVYDIRDTMQLSVDGNVVTTKEGTQDYHQLINLLDNVLEDYTLTDSNGKEINTGEKRIYAPNIVTVIDGEAKKLTSGISEDQTDGYMELTDKMKADMKKQLEEILEEVAAIQNSCTAEAKGC